MAPTHFYRPKHLVVFSLFASLTRAAAPSTTISVLITSTHTILQPRFEPSIPPLSLPPLSLPPVIIPSVTIAKFSLKSLELNLPTPTCVQTIKPDKNGHVPPGTCNALWSYYPSFIAAVVTAAIFGVITIVHVGEAIYFKTAYAWVISVGLFWECIGFIFRALSARNQQSAGILTVSQLSILLAPLWMNAFSYMVLGRMIHFYIPTHRLLGLKASTFASSFVLLDIICFIIQLIGGGMAGVGAPPEQMKTGLDIYKAGIALQEVFVIFFLGLAAYFHVTMWKLERNGILPLEKKTWPRLLGAVYMSLVFISARIVFRLVEFSHGTTDDNEILTVEWYQYAFDSVPIFLAGFVLVVSHPGMFMQGPDSVMPIATWRKKLALRRHMKKQAVDDEYDSMLLTRRK
ncbi:hypothetical protein VTL71DRAFT_7851 [Oculimacula yallundae]|uniref:RTA1-like protein n=1 Tax=Oculimacula yallundae TaxID=86028 RepID=A0ABR4CVV7_9HELO